MPTTPTKLRKPVPAGSSTSKPSPADSSESIPSAESSKAPPWGPVNQVADAQGLSFALFGPPGAGKSTLGASATSSPHGRELLIVNFDGDLRSLSDRSDLMAWPRTGGIESWTQANAFLSQLSRRKHPFKTIQFDTINAMYDLAYKEVSGRGSANRDGRQIFGDANDLVLGIVRTWSTLARETGINVVFVTHAEEKQEQENGPMLLRMAVTPGVVKGMYQAVSTIGCLLEMPGPRHPRKLLLHNTVKVVAKVHQPRTGPQVPLEIIDPDLGRMIEHFKGVRSYPTKEQVK